MNRIVRRFTEHITTSNPCFKQASQLCLAGSDRCPNRKSITPPVSAMPPMALSLPPKNLRDLIAYLSTRKAKAKDGDAHGDEAKVAK
jgi:hypothetical protein